MKKLEAVLNKLAESFGVDDTRPDGFGEVVVILVMMLLFEGLGIWMAVVINNYVLLSIMTFVWVWMITECIINKIFFEKLNDYLLETPKATTLIFWIILIASIIASWNYFVGFILSTILAFMFGDFNKNKEKE